MIANNHIFNRKVYISTVGWIGIILSFTIIYFTSSNIISIIILTTDPIFGEMEFNNRHVLLGLRISTLIYLSYFLIIIFSVFFLVSSFGLTKFKSWGRKFFIISGWIMIVISITAIIYYIIRSIDFISSYLIEKVPENSIDSIPDNFKSVISIKLATYGIFLIIFLRILLKIVLRLRKEDYKILFNGKHHTTNK